MYDEYYEVCRPSECQYEVKTRNNVIFIVTTVIGLIGGLVTSFTIVVPLVVKLIRRRETPRRQRSSTYKCFKSGTPWKVPSFVMNLNCC